MNPQNYNPDAPKRRYDKIKDIAHQKDFILAKYNSGARHREIMEALKHEKGVIVDAHHLKRYLREWGISGKNLTKKRKVYIRQEIKVRQSEGKLRHGVRLHKTGRELSHIEINKILSASPRGFEHSEPSPGDIILFTPAPDPPSSPNAAADEESWVVVGDNDLRESSEERQASFDDEDLFAYIEFDVPVEENDLDDNKIEQVPDALLAAVISTITDVLNNQPARPGISSIDIGGCAEILKGDYYGWIRSWRSRASEFILAVDSLSTTYGIFLEDAIIRQSEIYETQTGQEALPYAIWEEMLNKERTIPVSVREELRILEIQRFVRGLLEKYIVPMSEMIDRIKKADRGAWEFDLRSIILNLPTTITKYGYYHIFTTLSLSILANTVIHVCEIGSEESMALWNITLEAFEALGMSSHESALGFRRSVAETTYRSRDGYKAGIMLQQELYHIMQSKYGKTNVKAIFMGSRLAHMLISPWAPRMELRIEMAKGLLKDMDYHIPKDDMNDIIPYHLDTCFRSFSKILVAAEKSEVPVQLLTKAVAFCQDMRPSEARRQLLHAEVCYQAGSVFRRNGDYKSSLEYFLVPFHIFKDLLGIDVTFTTNILVKITDSMRERGPVIYLQPAFQKILEMMEEKGQSQTQSYQVLLQAWVHGHVGREELDEVVKSRNSNALTYELWEAPDQIFGGVKLLGF
ncbi:hypothetical protein TWF694_008114 [Orbilia ellipsospora]|uniref:Clr5 domain-containing protein n=1 Tax=Orbilia ellipsospora TaxID=2528407 RepID=A0AAV9XLT2_9PEZI